MAERLTEWDKLSGCYTIRKDVQQGKNIQRLGELEDMFENGLISPDDTFKIGKEFMYIVNSLDDQTLDRVKPHLDKLRDLVLKYCKEDELKDGNGD